MNKLAKIIAIIILSLTIIVLVGGYFIGDYFYNMALNPLADRSQVFEAEHNQVDGTMFTDNDWLDEVSYRQINIQSYDNLKLHSYLIENNSSENVWVIMCHGYTSNALHMSFLAEEFYEMGYSILLPDARGHGKSEGTYYGMGWHDRIDILYWIDYINNHYPEQEIILYGISMGGATVMMTAGEELPDNVRLIIEDSGYTSAYNEFAYQLELLFGLPAFPILDFADFVTMLKAGYSLKEASATKQLANATIPILFIHGADDTFVPSEMANEVYEAAASEKQLLIIPGAGHGGAALQDSDLYWSTIKSFIAKYLD